MAKAFFKYNGAMHSKKNIIINTSLTVALLTLIKKRNLVFKLWKSHGNLAAHLKYKSLRNKVVSLLRSEKRKYKKNLNIKNPKSFWRTVRQLRPNSQSIPTLCDGNDCAFTSQEKANVLSSFIIAPNLSLLLI